ncbi:PREDICTED: increased DNA methylation 3-like [Camelina sativa]|uniref:Increased DNA methylation 3-like n=1 Tax=Camelina sativa TaxID=90675 RepID=A0ABM0VQS5_CAMSA|nr:PREDICTED: increased DNA methylation 3-like [Camelina sativa]
MSLCSDGLSSDQYFLVNFIMSNYLGPDVYSDNPRCSASQRLAKGLPPYTLMHVGSSSLTVAQLQNLYYNVLRNAKSSLVVHPDMIYMYLKGYLPMEPIGEFPQFTSFFPTNLHQQKRYSPSHEIVKGVVVIDEPALDFVRKEELQRFRCLSRLNDLKIDRVMSLCPPRVQLDESRGTEQDCSRNGDAATSNGLVTSEDYNSSGEPRETCKRKKEEEAVVSCVISKPDRLSVDIPESQGVEQDCLRNGGTVSNGIVSDQDYYSFVELGETCKRKKEEEEAVVGHTVVSKKEEEEAVVGHTVVSKKEEEEAVVGHTVVSGMSKTPERFRETYKRKRFKNSSKKAANKNGETLMERDRTDKPTSQAVIPVPPPDMKECDAEPSVVTTGTASKGTLGPSVGVIDIGVNKVAYFFQVALPGVRKDYGEFSCEIESDGKVILEGTTTTGEKTIKRHSRVFEMNIRKLCPSGPFKMCFSLPGPVDPRLFSPNFRSDGIFEAVIIRHKDS